MASFYIYCHFVTATLNQTCIKSEYHKFANQRSPGLYTELQVPLKNVNVKEGPGIFWVLLKYPLWMIIAGEKLIRWILQGSNSVQDNIFIIFIHAQKWYAIGMVITQPNVQFWMLQISMAMILALNSLIYRYPAWLKFFRKLAHSSDKTLNK